ncbi:hypothetical protein X735_22965 [Mesorhizobium sp. L2C085B000]|nr:hypothetical protein X735_22965 [Mesorhizobium sp. L2C085B000]
MEPLLCVCQLTPTQQLLPNGLRSLQQQDFAFPHEDQQGRMNICFF